MQIRMIPLNCREKEYLFDLSVISEERWCEFIQAIVQARVSCVENLKINGAKIVLRDNKVKLKLFYQDDSYHEVILYCDEFGRISKDYKDIISQIWQKMVASYYGESYEEELNLKLGISSLDANDI